VGERVEEGPWFGSGTTSMSLFLDLLKAAYRRAIESDALVESIGIHSAWRDGKKCCQTPGKSVNRKSIIWTFLSLIVS